MPKKTDKEPQNWKRIWQMIRPYRGWMIASMVLAAFSVAFTLVYSIFWSADAIDAMVEVEKFPLRFHTNFMEDCNLARFNNCSVISMDYAGPCS